MPRDDSELPSIHDLTRRNTETAVLGVSQRLARVCGVLSPVRAPKLMIAHVGGETHHVP
jgi:hypothetical protein